MPENRRFVSRDGSREVSIRFDEEEAVVETYTDSAVTRLTVEPEEAEDRVFAMRGWFEM